MPRLPLLLTACLFAILPAAAVNAGDVTLPGTTRFDLAARPDGASRQCVPPSISASRASSVNVVGVPCRP